MKKIKLSQEQLEVLQYQLENEWLPWISNHCQPDMSDVEVSSDYEKIWLERQSVLTHQAIRFLKELL